MHPQTLTLTNVTTNKTLLLTSFIDGISMTFQVINAAQQPLENVDVTVVRNGDLIEAGTTDASGAITFFLNPDFTYTFTFTRSGFITFVTSLRPTTDRTITMATAEVVSESISTDTIYTITPSKNLLDNETFYNFSFKVESG
ncbi:unnamed protein product, partial [marine sediment metagenome]